MMIPQAGILRRVEGVLAAEKVPYIEEVVIDVREGYELVPLPEGSSYLGFILRARPAPLRRKPHCVRRTPVCMWW